MTFQFADIVINTQRYEIYRDGHLLEVEPLVLNLLIYLVSHPERLIGHDELIREVWDTRCVSASTISSAIKNARKALGDDGRKQRYIKTVYGRGFRFNVSPHCEDSDEVTGLSGTETSKPSRPSIDLPENDQPSSNKASTPSLLILPCRSTPGNVQLDGYIGGLVADLETILARIPFLQIKSYSSSEDVDQTATSGLTLCQHYGAQYLLDGSSQVVKNSLRFNVRLTDARTGNRLWGELFEVPLDDSGAPITQMSNAIAAKLEPQLIKIMLNSAISEQWEPRSESLYMQAFGTLRIKGWHKHSVQEAVGFLRKSIELDPDFPLSVAGLALVLSTGYHFGLLENRDEITKEALAAAERALLLDGMDSTVIGFVGCTFIDLGYITRAKAILHHAVKILPVNGVAWGGLGRISLIENDAAKAVKYLRKSLDSSADDNRDVLWRGLLAVALLRCGDEKAALKQAKKACEQDDSAYYPRIVLAIVFLAISRLEDARQAMSEVYRIKPDLSLSLINRLSGPEYASTLMELVS